MNRRKFLAFFICLVLIVSLIVACGRVQQPENLNNDNNRNNTENNTGNDTKGQQTRVVPRTNSPRRVLPSPMPGDNNGTNINTNLRNNANDNNDDFDNNEDYTDRVRDIAERAAELKEIESATCVITGDTALIGVQFDDQYKGGITNEIKDKVEEACKDEDPQIEQVVVTADPDVVSRIQDMLQDIGEGRPVSGFAEEINELINRIQPK